MILYMYARGEFRVKLLGHLWIWRKPEMIIWGNCIWMWANSKRFFLFDWTNQDSLVVLSILGFVLLFAYVNFRWKCEILIHKITDLLMIWTFKDEQMKERRCPFQYLVLLYIYFYFFWWGGGGKIYFESLKTWFSYFWTFISFALH